MGKTRFLLLGKASSRNFSGLIKLDDDVSPTLSSLLSSRLISSFSAGKSTQKTLKSAAETPPLSWINCRTASISCCVRLDSISASLVFLGEGMGDFYSPFFNGYMCLWRERERVLKKKYFCGMLNKQELLSNGTRNWKSFFLALRFFLNDKIAPHGEISLFKYSTFLYLNILLIYFFSHVSFV